MHEVDLILERADQKVVALEVKLSATPRADSIKHLTWLRGKLGDDLPASPSPRRCCSVPSSGPPVQCDVDVDSRTSVYSHDSGPVGVSAARELPALLDLAARAENDTAGLSDLQGLIRVGSSLGNARPKAHVRSPTGGIAIAKFPSADRDAWNVMAWEKVALDLAGSAGIDVPRSRLLSLAGRSVLVLDRFDRTSTGERVGYVSAMTMLEASDREQRSYLDIAEVIESSSTRATQDLQELWRRIVFTVLISNTDDHLRNHGFLHQCGDAWRLSPAFDLNPNPAAGPQYLATAIDGGDDRATLAAALAVAGYFRLQDAQARTIVRQVAAALSGWRGREPAQLEPHRRQVALKG